MVTFRWLLFVNEFQFKIKIQIPVRDRDLKKVGAYCLSLNYQLLVILNIYFQMLSPGRYIQLMLMVLPVVVSISIVRHIPVEEDGLTNAVYRKAYNLVPGLKKLRAKTPAVGKDFVGAVVTGLGSYMDTDMGVVASTAVTLLNWFLSSVAHLVPIEVVEWLLGRPLVQRDVMKVEVLVRDLVQIYSAWAHRS